MNQLEERLRAAGRSHADPTPDIESIMNRGRRIRRNRQIGTAFASVVIVVVGGVAAFTAFRPDSDATTVSATDGELDDADVDVTVPGPDEGDGQSSDDSVPPDPDSAEDSAEAITVEPDESDGTGEAGDGGDGGDEGDGSAEADAGQPIPSPDAVSDGSGGWLVAGSTGVEHLRADGSRSTIAFPQPAGGFAQYWPTDVAFIDGTHYLLVDQFVNRQDLQAERERNLALEYGVEYDPETGASELYEVASPEELDALNHWEVGILAVDLSTDEVITVENRVINRVQSPDWFYNGHITALGSNLMVMRELWQGHCLYAEGLTLDGQVVDIVDSKIYAKPEGLDAMTFEEIGAVLSLEADPPQPCRTLQELPDSGLGPWGTHADPAQMEAFRTAFFEAGLG